VGERERKERMAPGIFTSVFVEQRAPKGPTKEEEEEEEHLQNETYIFGRA